MRALRRSILLATDSAVPSGVGEHMLTLGCALLPEHDVIFAFPAQGEGPHFCRRAVTAGFAATAFGEEAGFEAWLAHCRPDILHVHAGIGWEGHGLVAAGWNANIPVIRTEHLPYMLTDPEQKAWHRMAAGRTARLVVVSHAAAESYRAEGFDTVSTIRNGIEMPVARGTRAQTRRELGIADETPVVVTVARFTTQKGHDTLLQAASEVARHVPRAVFLLVGDGPILGDMQVLADTLEVANVVFLGPRTDVPDLLAAADLFVLASLFEGLPLAVLEAMALALPVVATQVGGTLETLGTDHALLVPPGEPVQLAQAIVAAFGDDAGREAIGLRGQQRFETFFTARRMGQEMAALYENVSRMCMT